MYKELITNCIINPLIIFFGINGVFLAAVNFVLVHEFGHVYLGHIDLDNDLLKKGQLPDKKEIKEESEKESVAVFSQFNESDNHS